MGLNFTYDLRTGKLVAIVPGTQRPSRYTVAGRPICRHLGPATGETRVCPSCRGHVEVKVHKCTIYEECTTDKKVNDLHCCNPSDKCPSYMPLEIIEDSTTQRRVDLTHQRNLARFYPKVDKDYIAAGLKISREELDRATSNQGLSITHWRELMGAAKDKFSPGSLGLTLSEMGCTGCCGGGGSGSGSGSGGGGVITLCCPDTAIPINGTATISGTGTICDGSYPVQLVPASLVPPNNPTWENVTSIDIGTCHDVNFFTFFCEGTGSPPVHNWHMTLLSGYSATATTQDCTNLVFTWTGVPFLSGADGCCSTSTGTITLTFP